MIIRKRRRRRPAAVVCECYAAVGDDTHEFVAVKAEPKWRPVLRFPTCEYYGSGTLQRNNII